MVLFMSDDVYIDGRSHLSIFAYELFPWGAVSISLFLELHVTYSIHLETT